MIVVFGAFLLSALALAQTPVPQGPPSADEIAAAVRRLGDDEFSVREQASAFLWKAGKSAQAALEAAADSDDREVAIRAKEVLDRVKLGITPDSPPELIHLVFSFQRGAIDHKRTVLAQLRQKQQQTTMFTLIRNEPDEAVRKQLAREFVMDSRRVVIDLVAAGDVSGAEEMLSWTASFDESTRSQRDYAAFLYLNGRMEQKISALREAGNFQREPNAARLLATGLQIQGELRDALEIANTAGDKALQNDILYRLEDWAALAKAEQLPDGQAVEKLGAKAAYLQWAGDAAGYEAAVAEIVALPQANADQAWLVAEVLLCNGRWAEAGTILRKWDPNAALQLLVAQLKFREALTLAGVDDPKQAAAWYSERAKAVAANNQQAWQHFNLGLRVSRLLRDLGEEDAATELLAAVAAVPADPDGLRAYNVFVEELRQGRREQAVRRAAPLMSMESRASGVAQELFGNRAAGALQWWRVLREQSPTEDAMKTLQRLQVLFDPARDWPLPETPLEQFAAQAAAGVPALPPAQQVARLLAVAELAVVRKEKNLALVYLEKCAEVAGAPVNVTPLQWIGDLLAEDESWSAAAAAYGRAWNRDKTLALPLYLRGRALVKAGDKEEGERLQRLASLLPLADPVRRRQLAEDLAQRGLTKEASQQRELVVRFGAAGTWAGNDDWHFRDAARLIGDSVETTDPFRSAVLWQRVLFGVIRANSFYHERGDYARMFYAVHKSRARGLLGASKPTEALSELALATAARPGDIPMVEQLTPFLIAAGQKEAAEKLFADAFTAYEEICREFPQSAKYRNELAWLAARNDRRLDDALAHAQEAVRLRPDALNHVDTLAEVHFRRGDRDKAKELAKQNLMKEPNNKHFQEQLRRFEK
jgi:hypothetical protein